MYIYNSQSLKMLIIQKYDLQIILHLLLQNSKLLLKNDLKEFVLIGMNLFTIYILLNHYYCKNVKIHIYSKSLQAWLTVFLFVFEMSIYFTFSTISSVLSQYKCTKNNQIYPSLTKKIFIIWSNRYSKKLLLLQVYHQNFLRKNIM